MIKKLYIIPLFFLLSCAETGGKVKPQAINKPLIESDSISVAEILIEYDSLSVTEFDLEFISEDGPNMDGFYSDYYNFSKKYINYDKKELKIEFLIDHNACGEYNGWAYSKGDTIVLMMSSLSDEKCTSEVFSLAKFDLENIDYSVIYFEDKCISCLF